MTPVLPQPGSAPDPSLAERVTLPDVVAAAARLAPVARRTPALTNEAIDGLLGRRAVFKAECLQRIGAFKFRGGYNAMRLLREREPGARGVLTYSSGNHAQAIALASSLLDIPAVIVMPANAPSVKREGVRAVLSADSEVVEYDPTTQQREAVGAAIAEQRGLAVIPPYDHPDVIAGQGTATLELMEQARQTGLSPLRTLYVCCGGGGLLSGAATVAKAMNPGCEVVGVEPALADDAARSFETGALCAVSNSPTIADGTRTPSMGHYTFSIVAQRVDRFITASESEIARAAVLAMSHLKVLVEPSGALGLAGALADARSGRGGAGPAGIIISGGNLDLSIASRLEELAAGG